MKQILFALYLALFVGVYLQPLWGEGALITGDHPFYLAVALAIDDHVRNHGLLDVWSADAFAGFPLSSSFLPAPLGFLGMAVISGLTSVPVSVLYKAFVILAVVFPAFSLWLLLASRFHWAAAFAAVNLYLLLTYSLVQPLRGMWIHYLGVGVVILLIHRLDLSLTPHITILRAAGVGLLVALGALTDAFTWPILLVLAPLAVVFYARRRRLASGAVVTATIPIVSLSLLAAMPIAYVVAGGAGWGTPLLRASGGITDLLIRLPVWFLIPGGSQALLEDVLPALRAGTLPQAAGSTLLLLGQHLPEAITILLFLVGTGLFLAAPSPSASRQRDFLGYVFLLLGFSLLCVLGPWHFLPIARDLSVIVPYRQDWFVVYLNIGLIVIAAYALHEAWHRVPRLRRFAPAIILVALVALHLLRYSTHDTSLALKTSHQSVIHQELANVWAYLRQHADPRQSRVMYEELNGIGFLDGGVTNLAALSPHETGLASVVLQRPKTHFAFREPFIYAVDAPFGSVERITDLMKQLNCHYLVLWHPGIKQRLLETGALQQLYESDNRLFSVFRLKDTATTWLDFDLAIAL